MEGMSKDIYDYLSMIDKLRADDYKKLTAKYGTEIVHATIDYMIDEDKNNIGKFDYYVDKLAIDFDNFSNKSILDIYMQDIGRTPRLGHEINSVYAREAYKIICELRELFKTINCNYVKQVGVVFNSITDECVFYLKECCDKEILNRLNDLYKRFIYVRNILVEGNIRVVVAASKNYFRDSNSFIEIVQWGNIGLMKAVEKYDPNFDVLFVTYAYYWIRQAIRHALKFEFTSATTISYNAVEKNNVRLKAISILSNKLGRKPTNEEIAQYIGISKERLGEIDNAFGESVSLSMTLTGPHGNETTTTLSDLYEDRNVDVEREACEKMLRFEILEIVKKYLNEQQQFIILNKFGFYGEPMSFEQIGSIYGVTKQHIQQIQKRALAKIKRVAGNKLIDYLK